MGVVELKPGPDVLYILTLNSETGLPAALFVGEQLGLGYDYVSHFPLPQMLGFFIDASLANGVWEADGETREKTLFRLRLL